MAEGGMTRDGAGQTDIYQVKVRLAACPKLVIVLF